jgi:hypothetical protein
MTQQGIHIFPQYLRIVKNIVFRPFALPKCPRIAHIFPEQFVHRWKNIRDESGMLEIAFWAQNQSSFQRAEKILKRGGTMPVNDTTIRQVANFVGGFVFKRDSERAAETMEKLESGKLQFSGNRQGVIYIETDGRR